MTASQPFRISFSWDGRVGGACGGWWCAEDEWAPLGEHPFHVEVRSVEGATWRGGVLVELLSPEIPPYENDGEVVFLLDEEYETGSGVAVRVRNDGERTFRYRSYYAACDLRYSNETGYPFRIPQGTHCDVANEALLPPGETATLFTWDLHECLRDEWGCTKSAPLPPGTYHVSGVFREDVEGAWERPDASTRAGATFRIVAG